jgi:hypothetical protein
MINFYTTLLVDMLLCTCNLNLLGRVIGSNVYMQKLCGKDVEMETYLSLQDVTAIATVMLVILLHG